jgi:hypothetical protein
MEFIELIRNEYLSIVFGGLAGIGTAWLTQRVLNKRGLFGYYVTHNRLGMSSNDSIFGNVSVTWNDNPVAHLFLSTIELKNESLNDYENVAIQTYTSDTRLLTESTHVLDSPNVIEWSEKFRAKLHVEPGHNPTEAQQNIYNGQREYIIPVFNRGQVVRINYLNAANSESIPNLWLSATIKGVRIKFRVPKNQIFGVPQPLAGIVGAVFGLAGIIPLVLYVENLWVIALVVYAYGLVAQLPGVAFIKLYRKSRELIGG